MIYNNCRICNKCKKLISNQHRHTTRCGIISKDRLRKSLGKKK